MACNNSHYFILEHVHLNDKYPMIKKKHTEHKQNQNDKEATHTGQTTGSQETQVDSSDDETIQTILNLQNKVEELNDKYLRLFSEFDNYRKRTLKERIDLSRTASEEVIVSLLTILDDFDRAQKAFETTDNIDVLKEGLQLVYTKFRNILTQKGLKAMNASGEVFDTDFHEAITQIPAPSEDMKNKVIDEVEKGYLLNDKVIRYAKVVIGS
jgi:molecular chaperone GrpE